MGLNRRLKFEPDEDELDVLREKNAKFQRENETLQKQVEAMQKEVKGSQENPKSEKPPLQPRKSSIFLIIAALLVVARVVLFGVVEAWGTRASDVGMGTSAVLGLGMVGMILEWLAEEWRTEGWNSAGAVIFLAVGIMACIAILNPVFLETGKPGPVQHPVTAAAALIACFLLAASPVFRWIMGFLLVLVTDPWRAFQR
jgi:hypothetical protein